MEPTSDISPQSSLLVETWSEEPHPELDGPLLDHALLATSCLETGEREGRFTRLLRHMLALSGGERALLFGFSRTSGGEPEIAHVIASTDVDGDPVAHPERKAPNDELLASARTLEPLQRPRRSQAASQGRESSIVILPAVHRSQALAAVVIENRFQELTLDRERIRAARIYCQTLAAFLELGRLLEENESLWKDLARLRDVAHEDDHAPQDTARSSRPPARPRRHKQRADLRGDYSMIVGSSPKMLEILEVIDRISGSNAPVLISGESGTGKELVALAVHQNSPRHDKVFVSENCAAITETLLESELFGYVKGAFTGATKDHKGLFEQAVGGTLFLDEVGDMSPSMQKKLLRVLQEGVIRRVGAKDFTSVNVRIISATNKDLLAECRAGTFREDLYYRLNVINLTLPPLRERRDDIPDLVEFFLDALAREAGITRTIDLAATQKLIQYAWPGNIRELQNEVKRLFALADGEVIQLRDLSEHLLSGERPETAASGWVAELEHLTLKEATERLEQEMIRRALADTGGNKSLVAKTLQIPKTSLYNKIHKYGL